jgi:glycerophosphoryl diester phosphodiesterase
MVNVWTVNTLARYEHLMEIGADNVFCDNPYFLTL